MQRSWDSGPGGLRPGTEMVGGVFLSRPRPYMGCSAWKYGVVVVKGEEDVGISAEKTTNVCYLL
jgi:hypothetical protein